jgi:hypothetical protein
VVATLENARSGWTADIQALIDAASAAARQGQGGDLSSRSCPSPAGNTYRNNRLF